MLCKKPSIKCNVRVSGVSKVLRSALAWNVIVAKLSSLTVVLDQQYLTNTRVHPTELQQIMALLLV